MAKMKIKKGDNVIVLTRRDKGKTGTVLKALPRESRVIVQGINVAKRHQRQTASAQGGIVSKEMPIHISNIAIADRDGKPSRVGFKFVGEGEARRKVRFAKLSGDVIDG